MRPWATICKPVPCRAPGRPKSGSYDVNVISPAYDLWYDANTVGVDPVVETWISHGPRARDASFDPRPGDWVLLGDDDEAPQRARVTRRDDNRV